MVTHAEKLSHLGYVDALRGLAFLGVLLVHGGLQTGSPAIAHWVLGGENGVQLFFLLSALTLCRSLSVRRGQEKHPLRNYFIRRFFRVAPLFWFGIVLYTWLDGTGPRPVAPDGLHCRHFLLTATFLHGWAPTSLNSVVPGGWSVAVEMTFYVCLPWLFRRVTNLWSASAWAFAALVSGVVVGRVGELSLRAALPDTPRDLIADLVTHWFPAQLGVFLLGVAVYHLLRDERVKSFLADGPLRPVGLVAAGSYGVFALADADGGDWLPTHGLYAAAFVPIIVGLSARPLRVFVNPFTRILGTVSYSAYLTHFAALQTVDAALQTGWLASMTPDAVLLKFGLVTIGALLLTLLFSTVTYWLIERPGIALGRWLIARGENRPAARAVYNPAGVN